MRLLATATLIRKATRSAVILMSKVATRNDDVAAEIEQRRDALERLADSEYPIADTAAALLEVAEERR